MTDEYDPREHRRNEDPATSHQAAEETSREIIARHKQQLARVHLDQLLAGNYRGLTARETARLAGLDAYEGSKRCSDLVKEGKLEWWPAGDGDLADREGFLSRHNPSTERLARVLVLTQEGVDWLRFDLQTTATIDL